MSRTLLRVVCIALLTASAVQPVTAQVRYPWVYPGDFRERVRQADIVVSGTIASTVPKARRVVDGVEVTSNQASIAVDRVFKGACDPRLHFVWYSPAPISGATGIIYSGPPLARFVVGRRYLIFLRKDTGYVVLMPIYQIEVALAPPSPLSVRDVSVLPDDVRDSEVARELERAALSISPPAPGVTGLAAVYFPYVVDLIGGCAKPFLQHFTASTSKELRNEAQRWLTLLVDKDMRCETAGPRVP